MSAEKETSMAGMGLGMAIIFGFFFGGFLLMIWNMRSGESSIFVILFFMMGMPMIGCGIGLPLILKSTGISPLNSSGFFTVRSPEKPSTYVFEIPNTCTNCKTSLNAEIIDWVGPLTIQCPYCGATQITEKKRVWIF